MIDICFKNQCMSLSCYLSLFLVNFHQVWLSLHQNLHFAFLYLRLLFLSILLLLEFRSRYSIDVVTGRILFPVSEVPPQLFLNSHVFPSLYHLLHYLPESVQTHCLDQPLPQVGMLAEPSKEQFEEVCPHTRVVSPWILLSQLQIFSG